MNDQYVPTQSGDDNEPPFVYINQHMFGSLSLVAASVPYCVQVMLWLATAIDPDGHVKVPLEKVVQQCKVPPKKVRAVILGLAGAGLLESLDLSALAAGAVSCRISPDLIRYGKARDSITSSEPQHKPDDDLIALG
ncbi:hypothetical protein [Pseudomonas putida]|uniref:hypothetical protein n=1 Tax=Pseudomonas putida TaxID=303 RepID=UPI003F8CEC52